MKSNQEWIQWGVRDPLFGVAAWPDRQRGGSNGWTDEAFYELGESDWDDFISRWVMYGVDTTSCLEIGSGAGRLTGHMAKTFRTVLAIDVSADMLSYARTNIVAENITYELTNGQDLPIAAESVTAAFSTHVFQHFDSPLHGRRYFEEMARVLVKEGSLMIHMPMHSFPYDAGLLAHGMRLLYWARRRVGDLGANSRRRANTLLGLKPIMRGLSYETGWVLKTLQSLGYTDVEFNSFPVRSNGHMHSFVLARKGDSPSGSSTTHDRPSAVTNDAKRLASEHRG